jgi:hypothetical protein
MLDMDSNIGSFATTISISSGRRNNDIVFNAKNSVIENMQ